MAAKYGSPVQNHVFRSKDRYIGRNYLNRYEFKNGKVVYLIGEEDPLSLSFQRQIFLRESCYSCQYANEARTADFTAGDLWKTDVNGLDIERGCSVLLCNTSKAKCFLDETKVFLIGKINFKTALEHNIPYHHPVKRPKCRDWSYKLLCSGSTQNSYNSLLLEILYQTAFYRKKKMKKVGIITYHFAQNYGAVLQCYALQTYLSQQGYAVTVFDFVSEKQQKNNDVVKHGASVKTAVANICLLPFTHSIRKKHARFVDFCQKNLHLTPHFSTDDRWTIY